MESLAPASRRQPGLELSARDKTDESDTAPGRTHPNESTGS